MKVLAIRFARFGDIVLLLPALVKLKACLPDCHLTFLTDSRWKPLAEMCPAIDDIIAVDRLEMRDGPRLRALAGMLRLAGEIRRRRFDLVVDFHGFRETNLLSWWSGARQRLGLKRFDQSFLKFCFNLPPVVEDKSLHVADMFLKVVQRFGDLAELRGPTLQVPSPEQQWAKENLPAFRAVLFLGAPVADRMWSPQAFAEVADHLVRSTGVSIVAVASAEHEDRLKQFLLHAKAGGIEARSDLSIPQLAAVIADAQILVSNDTGPLHLGPALGIPTLGIFSVGFPEHFRPRGRHDRYMQRNPIDDIRPEEVLAVIDEMWANVRSDLQR